MNLLKSARCVILASLAVSASAAPAASTTNFPIDWRHRIPASAFRKAADGEWTTSLVQPAFPFEELIYSWHLHQPGDTFRLYLKPSSHRATKPTGFTPAAGAR